MVKELQQGALVNLGKVIDSLHKHNASRKT